LKIKADLGNRLSLSYGLYCYSGFAGTKIIPSNSCEYDRLKKIKVKNIKT
jgi:hypothetical protein